MEISRNSMIYRSYKFQHDLFDSGNYFRPSSNLCPFIRGFILRTLLTTVIAFMAAAGLITGILAPIAILFGSISTLGDSWWFILGCIIDILASVLAMVIGIAYLIGKYKDYRYANEDYDSPKNKNPGIVYSWFKAKHDKLCPQVSFVGENADTIAEAKNRAAWARWGSLTDDDEDEEDESNEPK
jgi:hypothetical protein